MAPAALPGADVPIVPWGDSAAGQASVDKIPASAADAIAIAAGRAHNIALKADGTVVGWFTNDFGQSEVPAGLSGVVAIAAGYDHNLALKSDGTVVAWGKNDSGQATVPGGLTGVVAVSANADRSLALKNDGSVVAWGVTVGVVPTGLQAVAIAAGINHNLALRGDGTVVGWGVDSFGDTVPPSGLSGVIAVAAGNQFSLALREDGTIAAWGNNTFGATDVPAAATSVIAITAGFGQALALKADGTVLAWGYNGMGEATVPPSLPSARGIAGGFDHSMALVGDQPLAPLISGQPVSQIARMGATVRFRVRVLGSPAVSYLWKKNGVDLPGETGPGLQFLDVHSSAQGTYTVTVNNTLGGTTSAGAALIVAPAVLWGGNSFNQTAFANMPLSLSNIVAISAGGGHNAAVKADGTLVGWGLETYGANVPPAIANGVAVATGYDHSLALRNDGTVVAWGRNDVGESTVPPGLSGVVAIGANERHSLALKNDGTLVAWGNNLAQQGNIPPGLVGVLAIASGVNHNVAVKSDGTVVTWGTPGSAVPGGLNNVVQVAAGNDFTLALKQDGTVVAWGVNGEGQTSVPPGLTDVVAVAAGFAHGLALRANGTVVTWGRSSDGLANVPTFLSGVWAISAGFQHSAALGGSLSIAPIIASSPVNQSIDIGGTVRFQVQAITYTPVTYQWQRNGVNVDGQTGPVLILNNADPDDAGSYTCVVTSSFGSATSAAATLAVTSNPPVITQQPIGSRFRPGVSVTLSVTATGSNLSYQWRKNGVPIPGETASTLFFSSIHVSDSGTYSVQVSNASGPTLSDDAELQVLPVVPWGGNNFGLNQSLLSSLPLSVADATAIAAGGGHNVARKADGTVVAWIFNDFGQSTVPPGLSGVVAVAAGYDHNLALKDDGSVVAWGRNLAGESIVPSGLTGVVAISANERYSLALKDDGTVVAWGNSDPVPGSVSGAIGISAGVHHSLAVLNDGSVVTWAANAALPPSLDVPPAALSGVTAVAAGNAFSLALKNDGTVVAWGDNSLGQTTVPGGATGVIAIAAGDSHALALRSDGTVVGWGFNPDGRATVPSGLTKVVAISAGYEHSLALVKEATVLTVEAITAVDKVYNGTTDAQLDTSGAVLVGVAPGDEVTLETAGAVATFANKTVGTAKTVTITGLALSGADVGKYILTQPTATASITAAPLTVIGITANNRVYNGNTGATLNTVGATFQGLVPGDAVTFNVSGATGAFANKNVGTAKPVTITGVTIAGPEIGNYLFSQPTASANITAADLTVSGITANDKVYNGNAVASLNTGGAALVGIISPDQVTLNTGAAAGLFADENVGVDKLVTVSGLTLSGPDGPNYVVTQPTTTASIAPHGLTVTGITANDKVYDGNAGAGLNTVGATLVGVVFPDQVTLNTAGAVASFANENVGNNKQVTISGLTLGGPDAGNYALTQPTTSASITPRGLTVTGITANGKVYNGNAAATLNTGGAALVGVIAPDQVTPNTAAATGLFGNKNVGDNKTVTVSGLTLGGTDGGNYVVTQPTTTASITPLGLTVNGVTANDKIYNGNAIAVLNTGSATLVGVIAPDQVTLNTGGAAGLFANKNVGDNKLVTVSGLTLGGTDGGNYTVSQPTATANITPLGLTVSGVTANDKVYNANAVAVLNTGAAALVGIIAPDQVALNTAGATGAFANKNVGNNKQVTVSGLSIGGTDGGNYTVSQPATTASITRLGLTVNGLIANDKVYNGNAAAVLNTASAALVGVIAPDQVTLNVGGAAGAFANKNVGNNKPVTVSGLTLGGTDGGNYSVAQPTPTASITALGLTVAGITANNKAYDGTTAAALNTGGATLVGAVAGDSVALVTAGAVGVFIDPEIGVNKTVLISGLSLNGSDAGNYALTQPTTTATITASALTVAGLTAEDKVYNVTTTATLNTAGAALVGVVAPDQVTLSVTLAVGTFQDKNVGTDKTVQVSGLTLGGPDAAKYTLVQPTTTADITSAGLTVAGITVVPKIYDATTAATLNTSGASLVGVLDADEVILSAGAAIGTFASKTVGTGKTVTITGVTISGKDAANYTLTQPTSSGTITARPLTVNGITASDKVYDATTTASLSTGGAALVGVIAPDLVTLNTSGAAGLFADKNAGNNKLVSIGGVTIGGTDGGNYVVTQPTATAGITAKGLTVTGVTASDKIYNGNAVAVLNTGSALLAGVIAPDQVTLNTAGAAGLFADKNAGNNKLVSVSGLSIGGTDGGNYAVTQPTASASITPLGLTVTGITANNKVYNGNAVAVLNTGAAALVGVIAPDQVTLSVGGAAGAFANKNVGNNKPVSISGLTVGGTEGGNYSVTQPTAAANITALGLTVTGITANNKVYDGTTAATLITAGATLVGAVPGDAVTLVTASAVGTFSDASVGVGKTVFVSGLTLDGADAANYTLTQPTTTATIAASGLTVTGITAGNKVYNGTTTATLDTTAAVLVGVVAPDQVTLSETLAVGTFDTKDVGTGKTVQISGLTLGGADAAKYTLVQPTATANITSAGLTVAGITVVPKVYDGTTLATLDASGATLVGLAVGDDVVVEADAAIANFATKTVGTGKAVTITGVTISGDDAANYTLTQPAAIGTISVRALTVNGITANNKVYDGNTTAVLNTAGAVLQALVAGDAVTLNTSGATGTFADENVGTAKPVTIAGVTIAGTDSGNYTLTQPSATANITAHGLTVTGVTANNKVYDGNTTAALNTGGAALQGLVAGDAVTLNTSGATGTFADENVGTAKPVTIAGVTIAGTDSGNYTLTQPGTTADITAHGLTVTGVTANNKVYDGNTTAPLNAGEAVLQGLVAGDAVTLNTSGATGTFANKNVGTAKVVTIAGLSISGTDSGNYTLTQPSASANITKRALTVNGITANNRTYNGNTAATLNTSGAAPQGVVAGDAVTLNTSGASGTFADKNVGTAKTVTIVGVTFGGADSGNYELTQPSAPANITKATLIAKADDKGRLVGQPNQAFTITYTGFVAGEGVSELDSQPTASTPATVGSGVGQYPILLSGGSDNNYGFTLLGGTLFVEEALLDLSMRFLQGTPGHFQISTIGEPNRPYRVQASADLIQWVDIGTVDAASDGLIIFTDTNAGAQLYRFYRLQAD